MPRSAGPVRPGQLAVSNLQAINSVEVGVAEALEGLLLAGPIAVWETVKL
ncbi:MAG: hypothetical protein U0Q22_19345 [Acidimicrobiales bacterium]